MRVDPARLAFLRNAIRGWGRKHLRRFPWRETRDAYRVLIAELMLRRTRPAQVLPVYETFVKMYPSPRDLGKASAASLYRLLTPLGLRWRARNVIAVAKELVSLSPDALRNPSALKTLPGVGDYVASTVQIMVSNRAEAVIDTNVIRVLGRYWGLRVHAEARRKREFKELAAECVPKRDAKRYTLALVDLGASICTPRRPRCGDCPLRPCCSFALNNLPGWEDAPREKSGKGVV